MEGNLPNRSRCLTVFHLPVFSFPSLAGYGCPPKPDALVSCNVRPKRRRSVLASERIVVTKLHDIESK